MILQSNCKHLLRKKYIFYPVFMMIFFTFCFRVYGEENPTSSNDPPIESRIYATLIEAGYSHAGACGILGNMAVENPDFDPTLESANGKYYGLFQWSDVGERRTNLHKFCETRLFKPDKITGQMAFAFYELQGGDSIACRLDSFLRETDDARLAAMEFAAGFERCVGETSVPENDGIYLGDIYPEYNQRTYQALALRIDKAHYYDEFFRESPPLIEDVAITVKAKPSLRVIGIIEDRWASESIERYNFDVSPRATGFPAFMLRMLSLVIGYGLGSTFLVYFLSHRKGNISNFRTTNHILTRLVPADQAHIVHTVLVILWDIAKSYLAFLIVFLLTRGSLGRDALLWTGLGIILGNDFPFWNRFRGGIGACVTMVVLCTYMPLWGPICILLGFIVSLISKSLPIGVFCITLFAVPFAFYVRGPEAGLIVIIEMLFMLRKQYKYLIRRILKMVSVDYAK